MIYESGIIMMIVKRRVDLLQRMRRYITHPSFSNVLVVNCGSSSIKYQVINPITGTALVRGIQDRLSSENYDNAMKTIMMSIVEKNIELSAVGHRWVNGGAAFKESVLITPKVENRLVGLLPLAP